MKKEIALLLADAITSGHYQRCTGINRNQRDEFCIGGVLINLFAQAHPELAAKETNPYIFMGHKTDLPQAVANWAGLLYRHMGTVKYNDMIIIAGRKFVSLQQANDKKIDGKFAYQVTWVQIAEWLRTGKNCELI